MCYPNGCMLCAIMTTPAWICDCKLLSELGWRLMLDPGPGLVLILDKLTSTNFAGLSN